MSFFTDLEASIISAAKVAETKLAQVYQFFKPTIIATAEELGVLALNTVLAKAPLVISGQEKFDSAVSDIKSGLAAQGKTAGLALIATAVQAAHDYVATLPKPSAP